MKGLELSRAYFEACRPELEARFPDLMARTAVGLCGAGSECWGFDDALSEDHDFEPAFCLFVPDDTDRQAMFELERAYGRLPREFLGCRRCDLDPVGGSRRGVMTVSAYFERYLGIARPPKEPKDWLHLSEEELSAALNGQMFFEGDGEFSRRRAAFAAVPFDVTAKKLAAHLVFAAQCGAYNFGRCAKRGEAGAAQLALAQYVWHFLCACHLTEGAFCPYYKWAFRSFAAVSPLFDAADALTYLLTSDNEEQERGTKEAVVEDLDRMLAERVAEKGFAPALPAGHETDLELLARHVQQQIGDAALRQMHIMAGI